MKKILEERLEDTRIVDVRYNDSLKSGVLHIEFNGEFSDFSEFSEKFTLNVRNASKDILKLKGMPILKIPQNNLIWTYIPGIKEDIILADVIQNLVGVERIVMRNDYKIELIEAYLDV